MRINIKRLFIAMFVFTMSFIFISNNIYGKEEVINIKGANVNVLVDPVSYSDDEAVFENVTNEVVLYTPSWYFSKTNRTENVKEYLFVSKGNNYYKLETIYNNSNNYIPLDGVILSVPTSKTINLEIDDEINLSSLNVKVFLHAIEGENGVRIAFNKVNEAVNGEFIYYNKLYGRYTNTNTFSGNELIARFDFQKNSFVVSKINAGGGNLIPEDGFVIGITGNSYKMMLNSGVMFNNGDKLNLVNLDYVEIETVITHGFSGINLTRYENYLVVYPASSNPTLSSRQNEHGFEVAVDKDGFVIEMAANVNIPEGGFALSGHGTERSFLLANVGIGDKITYDETTKKINIVDNVFEKTLMMANINYNIALSQLNRATVELYDINNVERATEDLALLSDLLQELEEINTNLTEINKISSVLRFIQIKEVLEPLLSDIYFDTLTSRKIESRGVWHRPFEKTLNQIIQTLDELESMNFTDVYLETFWNGYIIFKSDIAPYHVALSKDYGEYGDDYLKAFIAEAKKRNILVHAWVENFFVGVSSQYSSLWNDHKDWRIKNFNGSEAQTGKPGNEEEGFLYFDPANPGPRKFIINLYKELLQNYDIVGLQLDYIRYPSGNTSVDLSSGYTEYAMNDFKEKYNITGNVLSLVKTDSNVYAKWNQYRQEIINSFVLEVRDEVKSVNSDALLSIAVGPDADYARSNLMQDWRKWVNDGLIDIVLPMTYVYDVKTLENRVTKAKQITGEWSFLYNGLAPTYDGLAPVYNAYFTEASNKNNLHGTAIFASHNLRNNNPVIEVFQKGTYKNVAISPHSDLNDILEVFINDVEDKFTNIYIKNDLSNNSKLELLMTRLNNLKSKKYYNAADYLDLYEKLDLLTLELDLYASGNAKNRFNELILYFMEIIDIKINRYLINNGYWDLQEENNRPDPHSFEYPEVIEPPVEEQPGEEEIIKNNNAKYIIIGLASGAVLISAGFILFYIKKKK